MSVFNANSMHRLADGALLISHGFQKTYERGFCNGLYDAELSFILVSSDETDYTGLRQGVKTINLRGSQTETRPRWQKAINLVRYHFRLLAYVALHRPRTIHVIGLIEPPFFCGLIEGLWFRLWAGKYILTVHDSEPHDRGNRWNRCIYSCVFRLASHIVVHTQQLHRELIYNRGFPVDGVTVMEHGIESFVDPAFLPSPGNTTKPFKLLVFGYVLRYKGIDLVLEALHDFSIPFALTIAGKCLDSKLAAELNAQIAAHPHRDSIRWKNEFVLEDEITALFTQADALVLAYRRIDQSGVLLQAFRFGLPIIASRVGAFEDYVDQSVGECFSPNDSESLRMALMRLFFRYKEIDRAKLIERSRRFAWVQTVKSVAPLYSD